MRLQDDLLKYLEQTGWKVTREKGEHNFRAWYHEIWILESRWSPHSFTLFLTFLTDPQPGNPNPFWAIGTSSSLPVNIREAVGEPSLIITPLWMYELPHFVAGLTGLRELAAARDMDE